MCKLTAVVLCVALAGCSVSVGGGVETGIGKSVSRSWGVGVGSGPDEDRIEELDDLEDHCKSVAEARLSRHGGRFDWKSKRSRKGEAMQFSGTVQREGRRLQVDCQAVYGQPLRSVDVRLQPLD